jgi:hypothetical protein
VGTLVE